MDETDRRGPSGNETNVEMSSVQTLDSDLCGLKSCLLFCQRICENWSEQKYFNMLGKQSAAEFTQLGHCTTDGVLQGMDQSWAWKLASESAVNYDPAGLVLSFLSLPHRGKMWAHLCCIHNMCENCVTGLCEVLLTEINTLLFLICIIKVKHDPHSTVAVAKWTSSIQRVLFKL